MLGLGKAVTNTANKAFEVSYSRYPDDITHRSKFLNLEMNKFQISRLERDRSWFSQQAAESSGGALTTMARLECLTLRRRKTKK
jgi:hypothetical protein